LYEFRRFLEIKNSEKGAGATVSKTAEAKVEKLVPLGMRVPYSLHRQIKITAATRGITMEQLVIDLLWASLAVSRSRGVRS
jgi:predicted HicB family RNase H-like nuclease